MCKGVLIFDLDFERVFSQEERLIKSSLSRIIITTLLKLLSNTCVLTCFKTREAKQDTCTWFTHAIQHQKI